jgi:pimeloyl-ACP methyl ester carboxylesterase
MRIKKVILMLGAVCVLALAPASAMAQDVTIADWQGREITVTEGSVDSDGVKIVYYTAGEGPLVVFVHSIVGPWFDWRHQMPALAETHQVVAMSTRGTDKSDKPEGVEHYPVAKIAEDIDAIIRHFGQDRATIIGQDSGGFYAWNFAMTYPEKTERLIAIGSIHPAGLIRELAADPDQQQASMFQRGMQENPDAGANFGERIRSRPARPDDTPELTQLRTEAYGRLYAESIVNFYKANWPRPPFTMETEGFGFRIGEFPQVQAPTLVIYGDADGAFLPATLNDIWKWVDGELTLRVLPGVGHGPHTEVPEIVTPQIVEWLAR